jgi:hypothetical protein
MTHRNPLSGEFRYDVAAGEVWLVDFFHCCSGIELFCSAVRHAVAAVFAEAYGTSPGRWPRRLRAPPYGRSPFGLDATTARLGVLRRRSDCAGQWREIADGGANVELSSIPWPDFFWLIANLTPGIVLPVNSSRGLCAQTDIAVRM